jgi:hypothetical protein
MKILLLIYIILPSLEKNLSEDKYFKLIQMIEQRIDQGGKADSL